MDKAPSRYSPTADVDAAVGRASVVLRLMQEQGYINASQASVDVVNELGSKGVGEIGVVGVAAAVSAELDLAVGRAAAGREF